MKKTQKPMLVPVAAVLAAVLAALALWRFLPRAFSARLPDAPESVTASVMTSGIGELSSITLEEPADSSEVLSILAKMKVRPGLRNLLPVLPRSYTESGSLETVSVYITAGKQSLIVTVYESGAVTLIRVNDPGVPVFHLTDQTLRAQLVSYIAQNGIRS